MHSHELQEVTLKIYGSNCFKVSINSGPEIQPRVHGICQLQDTTLETVVIVEYCINNFLNNDTTLEASKENIEIRNHKYHTTHCYQQTEL